MALTEAQRLDFLINALTGGSAKIFADKTGINESAISRMRSGELSIRKRIDSIISAFPTINRDWILTGDGYPGDITIDLVYKRLNMVIEEKEKTIQVLRDELRLQQKLIEKFVL